MKEVDEVAESASSDDDAVSDAQPSSEEDEDGSDEGDAEVSDEGDEPSDGDDDAAPGRGRKRKARSGPGGSPSKKRGRSAGVSKKEAQAKKAHDKKVQKTLKRLRAPKSRPMQDLSDQVRLCARRPTCFQSLTYRLRPPSAQPLPLDPYQRALHLLHVGATPESLPCREEEYADVLVKIEGVIEGGGGGCICQSRPVSRATRAPADPHSFFTDISGQPGTGKTATVHAVVRELKQKARDMVRTRRPAIQNPKGAPADAAEPSGLQELPPFEYVEINGLKIPDPGHAYVVLWEALAGMSPDIEYGSDDEAGAGGAGGKGRSVSAKTALKGLEAHFGTGQGRKASQIGGPRRTT